MGLDGVEEAPAPGADYGAGQGDEPGEEEEREEVSKPRCDHYWCYLHGVWQAGKDDDSRVAAGRYCSKCGKMERAVAKDWKPLPKSYVDMREAMQEAIATP